MNQENKQVNFDLITKYLSGEATPEEAATLHESLKDQAYKDEYDRIFKLWNRLPEGTTPEVPSAHLQWDELQTKIKSPATIKSKRKDFTRFTVAASVIGLIVLLSYILLNDNKKVVTAKAESHVIKTSGEIKADTLPDGSDIILNKNSSIEYASNFSKTNRELVLTGESYFNVVPDKTNPFIITIDELKIKVVGTSFNVRKIAAKGTIEVQVRSGIVKMFTSQKEITIIKGQTGVYNENGGELEITDTLDVNSLSYATKTFSFNDLSIVEVCHYLEKAFNVIIKIDSNKFSACRLSAEFNNKSLEYILNIISATLNSNYKKQGNIIYITGEGCQ